jgi:aryl-alcohol dehydrogenase-like predicted oxidoreductase
MKKRKLGTQGLIVSELGLGCMGMSEYYGFPNEKEAVATIHRSLELGVNFIDTADTYGIGHNEELIGKAIRKHRDRTILATKFGIIRGKDGSLAKINGRPEYVREACEASLRRLGVEVIDLYYQHRVDPNTPIEDTVGAMAELVQEGKVRFLGLSEAAPQTVRRAYAVHPITALQNEYSLWSRDIENEILPICRELGIGLVAFSPLGRGFFTSQIKNINNLTQEDLRHRLPRFQGDNFKHNLMFLERIEEIAQEKSCRPSQLALAWLLAQGEDIIPIPGTKRQTHLEENVDALEIKLTVDDLKHIDEIAPQNIAAGMRYPEALMRTVNL